MNSEGKWLEQQIIKEALIIWIERLDINGTRKGKWLDLFPSFFFCTDQVVSVTSFNGGDDLDVVADNVVLKGTFRAFANTTFYQLLKRIQEVCYSWCVPNVLIAIAQYHCLFTWYHCRITNLQNVESMTFKFLTWNLSYLFIHVYVNEWTTPALLNGQMVKVFWWNLKMIFMIVNHFH